MAEVCLISREKKTKRLHGSHRSQPSIVQNFGQTNELFRYDIVERDWLGKSANFRETCLCLRFERSRDNDPAHNNSLYSR